MFAIIKVQTKKSFKAIKVEVVKINDVKCYVYHIKSLKKIKWDNLVNMLGDLKSRVILCDNIEIPFDVPIKTIMCDRYANKLAMNSLEKILEYNKEHIKNLSSVLIDIQCKYQGYADILLRYFGKVRIVTNKTEFYENYRDEKLYESGATVTITNVYKKLDIDNNLYVTPGGIITSCMENTNIPIISSKPVNSNVKSVVYHSFYEEPQKLIASILNERDLENQQLCYSMSGALYEYYGLGYLSSNVSGGYKNRNKQSIDDIKINIFSLDKNA